MAKPSPLAPVATVELDQAFAPLTRQELAAYLAALKRGKEAHAEAARMLRAAADNAEALAGAFKDGDDVPPDAARAWLAAPQQPMALDVARSMLAREVRRAEAIRLEKLRRRGRAGA